MSESAQLPPPRDHGARRRALVLAAAAGAALGIAWLAGPVPPFWAPPCPWHASTGLHCPGCGSTRALLALAHGDIARAFAQNPLLVLSLPLVLGLELLAFWRAVRHGQPPVALPRHGAIVALVVVVLFFVLRNLPWWPCTLLAPHG